LLSLSALTLLCVIVIFTRPQALYLPVILLGVLLYRAARQGRFSARWRPLALSFVLIYGLVLGYIAAFALTYGAFTMSKVSNADLLGTAMALHSRYHMPLDGADARFDQLRGDLLSLHSSEADPWGFIKAHPEYDSNAGALYGEFASQVLRAHPGYVVRGAYDTFLTTTSWNQAPAALGPLGGLPFWLAPLLQLSTVISLAYACLPLLFLATGMAAWRHPDDATTLALFALMSVVVVHIAVAVLADFESFNRLRFPVDWAMLLVSGLVVTGLLTGRISLRLQRSP
jgi:hypothetical protein